MLPTPPRWPAWSVLAGTVAVGGLAGLALHRYPHGFDDPGAPVFLVALCVLLALYLALAALALRRPRTGRGPGAVIGLVAGAAWSVEIWAGGPAMLDRPAERAVGATFALLAVAITIAAGATAGARGRDASTATRVGLFAGQASGVVAFCFIVAMTLTTVGILATRADYRQQFASGHSHAPDISTFLVTDALAAGVSHLVINLVLGLVGGGLGALIALCLRSRPPTEHAEPIGRARDVNVDGATQ